MIARNKKITNIWLEKNVSHNSYEVNDGHLTALTVASSPGNPKTIIGAISESGLRGRVSVQNGVSMKGEHPQHTDIIIDLAADLNGRWIASASYDTHIHLKEWRGDKVSILKEHSDTVYGLAFNSDGTLLASVSADRAMKVWDVEKGKLLYTLGEATDWLYTVAWSPDGRNLVSGGVDKSIRVYEATRDGAKLRQSVFAHEGPVQKLLFSKDSKTLYSLGQDRVVKAWDVEKMIERKVYDKQPETVLCMALREDAGQIILGRYDGIVQLIDMKTGKVAHEFGAEKPAPKPRDERSDSRGLSRANTLPHLLTLFQSGELIAPPSKEKGILDRPGAIGQYRLNVKKGEQLAVRITIDPKSKFEPVLTLSPASGRTLASSHERFLAHTFTEAGEYWLNIRDREYRGGPDFQYQLHFDKTPIVTSLFPLGVQRGTTADIQLDGVFLPKKSVSVMVPKDAKVGDRIALPLDKGVLGPTHIVVGEFPEVLPEPVHQVDLLKIVGTIPIPGTANGRIQRDNQQDVWSFIAKKGQPLVVEVMARRLGSRLDSVIEILDANDRPVPRAVLRSQAKTHVTFRDHDSAQGNIRIEAWSELGVNDYLYVGNELMKIQALPTHPDADCNFFATQGQRIGYLDTTPTHHANGTPMYKVSVHPPGSTFPPNGYPTFTLLYRNDDGGPGYGRDSRLLFDPPADGEYKVRIGDARGMGGVNFGYRLTVRPPQPSFRIQAQARGHLVKGGALPMTITAERFDGYEGPIHVRFKDLQAGTHAPETTIEAGTFSTTVALFAEPNAKLPEAMSLAFECAGEAMLGDQMLTSRTMVDMPLLVDSSDILTTVKESEVAIKPGGQAKMTVSIERRHGFQGRVPLEVRGLPHGVRVLDIGLNGILVNENETTRTVTLYAEPWVQAQDHPFVVLARREGKNTEHAAKSVLMRVK